MITVKDLTRKYAHTTAVDHISFSVDKGQIIGFLGPNGAGKTTTMRMLTCFLPPTSGTATVAGYDILEQSMEVRRRIGYLPELPPLYLDMETAEYLRFVGRLKGLRGAELDKRVDYVCGRCSIADMKKRLLGKLSKGYRQRVGLAQAIIHNPDVLILDEPTAGLDPKQINETRDLIKDLAGEHTIILSTHILPEVEQTCEHVVIINKGHIVATDSVANLQARARGAEVMVLEVAGRGVPLDPTRVQQRLEQVAGVSQVRIKVRGNGVRGNEVRGKDQHGLTDSNDSNDLTGLNNLSAIFETESHRGELVRGDLARAVIESGWDLNELRPAAMSLEEIFLALTGSDLTARQAGSGSAEEPASETESGASPETEPGASPEAGMESGTTSAGAAEAAEEPQPEEPQP